MLGTGWVPVGASGVAGEGLPLGPGTNSFCGALGVSELWPDNKGDALCERLVRFIKMSCL